MAKRPTPKQKRSKRRTRIQHSAYVRGELKRLQDLQQSPYAVPAKSKNAGDKALEKITRIKA